MSTIWITGAAQGVGAELVSVALRKGYNVVASDVAMDHLNRTAGERAWESSRVMLSMLDVREEAQWRRVAESLVARWKTLDVMVNNAGVIQPGWLREASIESMHWQIDVNLKGLMLGSHIATELMVPRGRGHIVNIASLAGVAPVPGLGY